MASVKTVTLDKDGLAKTSGTLTVYNFDPDNGIFIRPSEEFLAQGVSIPANSTCQSPPEAAEDEVNVFTDGAWLTLPDHRGELVYSTATGEAARVTLPGGYPEGTTPLKPETPFDKWTGKRWQTDAAEQQKAQITEAEADKRSLVAEANDVTQAWQTQLMLGIITDADKTSLTAWMKYIQAVQNTDTSTAPAIDWPNKPE